MSIFDIFGTSAQNNAAQAQIGGINAGLGAATGNINAGTQALQGNYGAALQPYLQNYSQAQPGVKALGNALGLGGARGNASAEQAVQATPGYSFAQNAGTAAVNAGAAANGTLNSGNQSLALQKQGQGLADNTFQSYVQNLLPYMGLAQNSASGIAGVDTGLGNAVAGQDNTLAGLNYSAQTGIGNANANAALAPLTAGSNIFNAIGALGKMGTPGGGTIGGNAVSGIGSAGSSLMGSVFSDERLKENIEKVGELYDGLGVFRYRYIGDDTPRIGLMAQEVEKTNPEAVTEIGGYKAVDYGKATRYAADLSRFLDAA